ncbi:helicase [Leucania separata nucleopolyhedrovirus]|uniref:Helicase n=1 Tax=Leucania separata nucleopolyhedrovirus TaxID=1307956 RepID=Q0IL18_NPVLS|nr:helicase [Leucania separata nucleopolyhedrovirus]AAR28865.1 helicase [Leucania separata nucleopolyhedrovirus]
MSAYPMSTDSIFNKILDYCQDGGSDDRDSVSDLTRLDKILFRNGSTGQKRCLKSYENFEKLLTVMSNEQTSPNQPKHNHSHRTASTQIVTLLNSTDHDSETEDNLDLSQDYDDDDDCINMTGVPSDVGGGSNSDAHNWFVHGNYFAMKIRPFVRLKHYDIVKDAFDFEDFVVDGNANDCKQAGEYVYWPNVAVSYFGWRLFLKFCTGIDIGTYIPIVHNRSLGNVNLFVFQAKYFVSIELIMTLKSPDTTLFVNGTSITKRSDQTVMDDLFYVTTTNGSEGVCKIVNRLVYSNKDIFEYVVDDIHLESCRTKDKYADMFHLDIGSMRTFDSSHHTTTVGGQHRSGSRPNLKSRPESKNVITASSEHHDTIERCVDEIVNKIVAVMQEALSRFDIADEFVLCRYFDESEFVNFDYIIMAVWKCIRHENKFEYRETDIKLFIELLCKKIFGHRPGLMERAFECCSPYFQLTKPVFKRLCADLKFFHDVKSELAHFYAVHYAISMKQRELGKTGNDLWTYTLDTAVMSGIDQNVLCNGYVKKLTVQSTHSIFNGKHYTVVKKDDDLIKITDKTTSYNVSNLKFNSWKYLYLTEHGVFNVITMKYHDSCPFIVGNCLIKSFVDRDDRSEFASKSLLDYMLKSIKYEIPILKVYHVAKVARDLKVLKKNVSMVVAFDTCPDCKTSEKLKLNKLFREIWNMDRHESVMLGVYLNVHKMNDLRLNMRCSDCANARSNGSKCDCLKEADIDFKAFKVALTYNLFFENSTIIEMAWALLYDKKSYGDTLKRVIANDEQFDAYIDLIQTNRVDIVRRLYDRFDRTDFIFELIDMANDHDRVKEDMVVASNQITIDECVRSVDALTCQQSMPNFFQDFMLTVNVLNRWRVWWDKLIVARPDDDLFKWLLRFYMRIIMSKVDTSSVSPYFLRMLVHGYLYFRVFTNFNDTNSLLMMHFTASLAIPNDYEKLCIYLNGESNCGKSSFFDLLDTIIVAHKRDSAVYNTTKKETDEMEANKLISQLYVINEMKECNDAFFKNSADSSKSNSVCRKYEGSQKYEANYKLLIVNNKPLCIRDYDKGVRNRFCVVYMKHVFVENLPFSGSVYDHYKNSRYPMEKGYYETLKNPVRIFAAHILKYKRNPRNGYVYYKCLVSHDAIQKHNLMCLDLNNHPFSALVYILRVAPKPGMYIEECRVESIITEALPHLERFCHPMLKKSYSDHVLSGEFRNVYSKYYRPGEKMYVGLTMARNQKDFNLNIPTFKC